MRSDRERLLLILLLVPLACAGREPHALTPPSADPCAIAFGAATKAAPGDARPVIIALHERIDASHAPRARNESERFVFAQLYETLVRLDCHGRAIPALAESWTRTPDGRGWLFTLRAGARFDDDTALTATDVAASWTAPTAADAPVASAITAIAVLGERALRVELNVPADTAPTLFADEALAVHKPSSHRAWPYGTGRYRAPAAAQSRDQQFPRTLLLEPVQRAAEADASELPPPLEFRIAPDADPRNTLDAGANVLITTDAAAISYAASHPAFTSAALPWDVTYLLVTPARTAAGASGSPGNDAPAAARTLREQLARDAVPGTARPAEPKWADRGAPSDSLRCTPVRPTAPSSAATPRTNRIVYPRSDRAARGLAERLVALATANRPDERWLLDRLGGAAAAPRMVAAGLSPAELAAALRTGAERAYVVPVAHRSMDACAELGHTTDVTVLPLVDTRPTAILRRGLTGVVIDGSGVLLLERARWTSVR